MLNYICNFKLNRHEYFALWRSNDVSEFMLAEDGSVPVFTHIVGCKKYAENLGVELQGDDPILIDLDVVGDWLAKSSSSDIDCNAFLKAWNLFEDLDTSKGRETFSKHSNGALYKKLFCGSNLPSVTPEGKPYFPVWTDAEVQQLRHELSVQISQFSQSLKIVE